MSHAHISAYIYSCQSTEKFTSAITIWTAFPVLTHRGIVLRIAGVSKLLEEKNITVHSDNGSRCHSLVITG